MFIFYSIHYPHPEKEEQLAQSMHEFGKLMKAQPGNLFVAPYPFKNPANGTLMGLSLWESQEAFQAALSTLESAQKDRASREWETRPTEVYMLNSVH